MKKLSKIRIGVSSCLLGENVRFDGNHREDRYIKDILGSYVEWVPVCPEVEVGMGVPRETVHLKISVKGPRMIATKSGKEWTAPMNRYSKRRAEELSKTDLSGYLFKKGSPSCGWTHVPLYSHKGMPVDKGPGLFAGVFMKRFPLVPVEDEGRLKDAKIRENFITRVFSYHRLKNLFAGNFRFKNLIEFHAQHKYLLLAHSPRHYKLMGQYVAKIKGKTKSVLEKEYGALFMEALSYKATRRKHVNVLQHMHGFIKSEANPHELSSMLESIRDYQEGLVPLIVPTTLIKHFVNQYDVSYLKQQVYLNPHPKELMLRNHV